jgi:hypothetical protein
VTAVYTVAGVIGIAVTAVGMGWAAFWALCKSDPGDHATVTDGYATGRADLQLTWKDQDE